MNPVSLAIRSAGLTLTSDELPGFTGIRVVPDVHGAFDAFDAALRDAERDQRFVVQLGDLIDRGPYSTLCVERMLEVEQRGLGRMLLGNHEVAFARFILSGMGGAVTRQATLMEFEQYGDSLLQTFIDRIQQGPLWIRAGNHFLVHAAFHPRMLHDPAAPPSNELVDTAIHGTGTARERREDIRSRGWVDQVPKGMTVIVGHAVTPSGQPELVRGHQGGEAIFADTGSWLKADGKLAVVDIPL